MSGGILMIRPIIIDCDPGLDDAMALILANKIEDIEVVGVTTVAGNASLENTSKNALNLLYTIDWELPVVIGSEHPLIRERSLSNKKTGIGELVLQKSNREFCKIDVSDFIYKEAKKYYGNLEILALAPMTNIAKTIIKHPDIIPLIKSITFMGGTMGRGNITPSAEFNIYVDPHAADIVFKSGIPITMVGLDITRKAFLTIEDIDYFKRTNNIHSRLIEELLLSIHNRECLCAEKVIEIHDVVALAAMALPELVNKTKFGVSIELNNNQNLGMLLLEYRNISDDEKNIDIVTDIDINMFKNWIKRLNC